MSQPLTWWPSKMARIGWVACGVCGNPESSVTENAAGTLSVSCHKCQFSGYGKAGTKAARIIRGNMTPDEDAPAPAKPKTPDPDPAPANTPKPAKRGFFDMGSL